MGSMKPSRYALQRAVARSTNTPLADCPGRISFGLDARETNLPQGEVGRVFSLNILHHRIIEVFARSSTAIVNAFQATPQGSSTLIAPSLISGSLRGSLMVKMGFGLAASSCARLSVLLPGAA